VDRRPLRRQPQNVSAPDGTISLEARGRVRRRKLVNVFMEALAAVAALGAVAILAIVVLNVLQRGLPAINLDLFTQVQAPFGETGGGIAHAIVGTIILVLLATLMALPFGVLVAIYVSEFAWPSVGRLVRLALDVLNGVPSIVIGIFVFAIIVQPLHHQSGWAGAFALAIVMLPLVARAAIEVLLLVPQTQREASFALGVSRWRTVLRVVLPAALGGMLTGAVLAVARAAGETAPLLFTSSLYANHVSWDPREPLPSLPLTIFTYAEQADQTLTEQAWAAAVVLIVFVLVLSVAARLALASSRRKLGRVH
jgi:phosphate transport system permease protein